LKPSVVAGKAFIRGEKIINAISEPAMQDVSPQTILIVDDSSEIAVSVYCPQREHFVAVFDAITERKQADEALKESERRLAYALDATGGGVWDWNVATGEVATMCAGAGCWGLMPGAPAATSTRNA